MVNIPENTWLKVFAGRHDLSLSEEQENGQHRQIQKVIVHENYFSQDDEPYDIALMKVTEPLQTWNVIFSKYECSRLTILLK